MLKVTIHRCYAKQLFLKISQNSKEKQYCIQIFFFVENTVLARDLGARTQKDKTVIFEELLSIINMCGCHEQGLFTMEKCNYYVLIYCIRYCQRGVHSNYFTSFVFAFNTKISTIAFLVVLFLIFLLAVFGLVSLKTPGYVFVKFVLIVIPGSSGQY